MPTLLLFLPLLGSLVPHAPVLRFNLLRCLKYPIDGVPTHPCRARTLPLRGLARPAPARAGYAAPVAIRPRSLRCQADSLVRQDGKAVLCKRRAQDVA